MTAGSSPRDRGWPEQSEQVRLLLDIAQAVTSTLDLDRLYGLALDRLHDLIPFTGAVIATRASSGSWRLVASRRPPDIGEGDIMQRLPGWNESAYLRRLTSGNAFLIDDIRGDDPLAIEYRNYLPMPIEQSPMRYFRSMMEVPLMLSGRVVGEVSVSHAEPGYLTQAHLELVAAVGNYIVIAMENGRLYSETQTRAGNLSALLELSQAVTSTLDLEQLYETALDRLRELIPYVGASIGLRRGSDRRQVAARRPPEFGDGELPRPPGWHESEFMTRVAAGEWVRISDIRGDEPLAHEYREFFGVPVEDSPVRYFRSILSVPLAAQGRVIGDLSIAHADPGYFTTTHVDLALAVANHIAIAIENARLFAESESRTNALSTMLDLSEAVTSTLNLEDLYDVALKRLRDLIPYTGANIGVRTPEGPRLVAALRPDGTGLGVVERRDGWHESSFMRAIAAGQPVVVGDVRGNEPLAIEYCSYLVDPIQQTSLAYVRSIVCMPLKVRGVVIGELSVAHSTPDFFDSGQVELISSVANQVAIAIQNARLYADAQDHARELESLLEVSRSVGASLDVASLAHRVLDLIRGVLDYENASLVLREDQRLRIAYANSRDDPRPRNDVIGITFDVANGGPIWETLERGEPLVVGDNRDGGYWSQAYRRIVGELYDGPFAGVRSWLGVPLRVRGQTIGFITLSAPKPNRFGQRQVDLAMAYAAQVSLAFENADLLAQAQAHAAMDERQRLARELHDSVSQALYGIALGARTARTRLDRDPAGASEPMDYVLSLAEAGLAEMRALIFELRPESLEMEGLVAALEKQVAATRARYGLQVDAELGSEPNLAPAARETFYRIAQESLHNVVKHAHATTASIRLHHDSSGTLMTIRDDGLGFDPGADYPGHLGLQGMRERASRIGATLAIVSQPGSGCTLRLHLPPAG